MNNFRQIEADIARTRAELEQTLNAIEDKFNIPKQAKRARAKAEASIQKDPTPWIIGAVGAVVAIGALIAWGVSRSR